MINVTTLANVPETLLIPLLYRARESVRKNGIISDQYAEDWIKRVDYDWDKFDDRYSEIGVAVRTEIFDSITSRFIKCNPKGLIVNLGAGLCSRFLRLDNGYVTWFELDVPEAIGVRSKLITPSHRYRYIAKSVFDYTWVKDIAQVQNEDNGPILIIAEGLLMFFSESDVKSLFREIGNSFPGAEMAMDVLSPLAAKSSGRHKSISKVNACFKWGVRDIRELEDWGIDINLIDEYSYFDHHPERWGIFRYLRHIRFIRRTCLITHIRFAEPLKQ